MPLDWSPLVAFVHRHHRFLLTTHVRPDCDGLGSMLALGEALEALGKQVVRVIPSPMPPKYGFLDPTGVVEVFAPSARYRDCDAIIVLDTGTWNQLADVGPFVRESPAEKVVIDHHRTQDDLGAARFVDVTAEATGRLAHEAIAALGVPLTKTMAHHLFAAVATDTGWFRHPNATKPTFYLAGDLVGEGAELTPLHEELYERDTLERLKLKARVLDRVTTAAGGRVAYSWVRLADFPETGAIPPDTEDMINEYNLPGAEVRLFFVEQAGGAVKVSFRARRADVSKLAEQFGGGGHRLASGATVPGPLAEARERVLAAAAAAVELLR
ncbi:MAG TPA: bifunctional oligoribonuclease/PAP phosphatase NrnA [Gemmataceae bacterium]|jgi:phosphoesterase RecJ-like protein